MEPRSFLQHLNPENLEKIALETFERQCKNVPIYRSYVELLGTARPQTLQEIPFLPISFFKTHRVCQDEPIVHTFESSGTGGNRSQHLVNDLSLYKQSFLPTFKKYLERPLEEVSILALLPSYLSLIHI